MDKSDKDDRNGNAILLIIIAIATMVIVVVGATFAYLADIVENEATVNIGGKTDGGSDMFILDAGDGLSLSVNYDNFGVNSGDQTDSTVASIMLAPGKEGIIHKYSMYLNIVSNNFEYTTGKCYARGTSSKNNITSKETCIQNSGLWARSASEADYSCYPQAGTSLIELGQVSNNEITCGIYGDTIWAQGTTPELVLDLYITTNDESKDACLGKDNAKGVCIKDIGTIEEMDSASACIDGTWVSNEYKANKCYKFTKRIDVTEAKGKVEIFKDKEITSTKDVSVSHYYMANIRMINLNHNQAINTSKLFSGNLVLAMTDEDVQTAP